MGILTGTSPFSFWNSVSNMAGHEGPGKVKKNQNGRAVENQIVFALHGKFDIIKLLQRYCCSNEIQYFFFNC